MSAVKEKKPVEQSEKKTSFLRLRIDQDLHRRFKAACAAGGLNMNQQAVEFIEQWLEGEDHGKNN